MRRTCTTSGWGGACPHTRLTRLTLLTMLYSPCLLCCTYYAMLTMLTRHTMPTRRVLALGSKPLQGGEAEARGLTRSEAEHGLLFCGFLVLHCPPKPESAGVLEALRASSHELQMITGDQLLTACQVSGLRVVVSVLSTLLDD